MLYLFDLDDTLLDTQIYTTIYPEIIQSITDIAGLSSSQIEERATSSGLRRKKSGRWDSGELCQVLDMMELYYSILESQLTQDYELIKFFARLKQQGNAIWVLSHSLQKTIDTVLMGLGISIYVDFQLSARVQRKDTTSEFWYDLVRFRQVNPSTTLVIDDDPIVLSLSAAAGFQTLLACQRNFLTML